MPTREEIQMAMQNIPVPEKAFTPAQTIQEKIQAVMQNIPVPEKAFTPAQTIQEKIQAVIQNMPVPIQRPGPVPDPELSRLIPITRPGPVPKPAPRPAQTIQEKIQAAMQNMPTPTAPASSMPKFNLPQMQSFGLPQQIVGGRTLMSDFSPRNVMRMANGGGIDQAIYDLKFKLNG
jgi:ABC-type dipeptide/oligopeptide/nickel transport system ATPase subunit